MFDDDGNGTFDFEETTSFIRHTLMEMGESPEYLETDFLQCSSFFLESASKNSVVVEKAISRSKK